MRLAHAAELEHMKTHDAKCRRELAITYDNCLQRAQEGANKIIDRLSKIDFSFDPAVDRYVVTVGFGPMLTGFANKYERDMIADRVGRMVAAEISTGRFVVNAAMFEENRQRKYYLAPFTNFVAGGLLKK